MANHSPLPNNFQVSKTWDEAVAGQPAGGAAELPNGTLSMLKAAYTAVSPKVGTQYYYATDTQELFLGGTKVASL